jgi:hypothetical protein
MAKLTTKDRKALPASKFAGPDRSFPVNDKSHAANAKARASQAVNAGRMSKAQEEKIDAKADKVLGKGKSAAEKMYPNHGKK